MYSQFDHIPRFPRTIEKYHKGELQEIEKDAQKPRKKHDSAPKKKKKKKSFSRQKKQVEALLEEERPLTCSVDGCNKPRHSTNSSCRYCAECRIVKQRERWNVGNRARMKKKRKFHECQRCGKDLPKFKTKYCSKECLDAVTTIKKREWNKRV